jgi:hypothetical protein
VLGGILILRARQTYRQGLDLVPRVAGMAVAMLCYNGVWCGGSGRRRLRFGHFAALLGGLGNPFGAVLSSTIPTVETNIKSSSPTPTSPSHGFQMAL